ncbi:MAG TPA: PqqD family protein [Paludibacter sp.]|nr:PqqD family protein [Paludibacter sp.]
MKVRKNIATSDEGFIFNPMTGDSFSTNRIGAEIIELSKKDLGQKEIVEVIVEKYDVDKTLFERDLEDFTIQLKEFNILE